MLKCVHKSYQQQQKWGEGKGKSARKKGIES